MGDILSKGLQNIRDDKASGATQLADRTLGLLLQICLTEASSGFYTMQNSAKEAAREIARLRPSMAPIGSWAAKFVNKLSIADPDNTDTSTLACQIYDDLMDEKEIVNDTLIQNSLYIFPDKCDVATLSYSSTIERILITAKSMISMVSIAEPRQGFEDRKLAQSLMDSGIKVTLVTDAQLAMEIRACDLVLIGADLIFADGAILNKTGSLTAGLAAHHIQKPLYVAADTYKINPLITADQVLIEGHPLNEIWPENPQVRFNKYFESLPPELITGYITEVGLLSMEGMLEAIHRRSDELSKL